MAASILSELEGAGKVSVMITLKSTSEKVVEKDVERENGSTEEEDSEGGKRVAKNERYSEECKTYALNEGEEPYVRKEICPEIEGVVVLAEGGSDAVVKKNNPGESVLTSGSASGIAAEAKVTREQTRARNKEMLMEILDNERLSQEQKTEAVNQVVLITEMSEKEMAAETLLASKGFQDSVVSLTEDSADVLVGGELDEAKLAQIEDIVTRKTGVLPEKMVITPIQ